MSSASSKRPAGGRLSRRRLCVGVATALLLAPALDAAAAGSLYDFKIDFTDDAGVLRSLAEWRGKPVIIAMAYGACRSVCSTTLRTLEEIQARADDMQLKLDFLVVSIDPLEDTPAAWADYRKSRKLLRSNWTFLCGSARSTRTLARFLGVRFWSYDEHVLHDLRILRLTPGGEIGKILDWQHRKIDALFMS